MATVRQPDWKKPIATGLWGYGYRLSANCDLVLLSNGTSAVGTDPDRLWLFFLMRDDQRNVAAEQDLKAHEPLPGILECRSLNNENILGIREKHIETLLVALTKTSL